MARMINVLVFAVQLILTCDSAPLFDVRSVSSETTTVRVESTRSRRSANSSKMPDEYSITFQIGKKDVKSRLIRSVLSESSYVWEDAILDTHDIRRKLKRDWDAYWSPDVDGQFIVHRNVRSGSIELEGHLLHSRNPYIIQHGYGGFHVLHKLNESSVSPDYSDLTLGSYFQRIRRRRAAENYKHKYIVELYVVVHPEVSKMVMERFKVKTATDILNKYYHMILMGIDRRFQSLRDFGLDIGVKGVGLNILAKPISAISNLKPVESGAYFANEVLRAFYPWAKGAPNLPSYDHAILLTGFTLVDRKPYLKNKSIKKSGLHGIASTARICKQYMPLSVVNFRTSLEMVQTATHELGHNLGSKHDGDPRYKLMRSCRGQNVMKSPSSEVDVNNVELWWKFSRCSYNMINNYIKDLRDNCLITTTAKDVPKELYYGQLLTFKQQCDLSTNTKKGVDQMSMRLRHLNSICYRLYCNKYYHRSDYIVPLPGTSCGNKKWCIKGKCVFDSRARSMDESCPFGDVDLYCKNLPSWRKLCTKYDRQQCCGTCKIMDQ